MRNRRLHILRIVFLFIIPGLALFFMCAFFALLLGRPGAVMPISEADVEATVQARVDRILSDQPPVEPAPAQPPAEDRLTNIVREVGNISTQLLGIVGLQGVGESIGALLLSVWGFISGFGLVIQLLCCCLIPIALLAGVALLSNIFGD